MQYGLLLGIWGILGLCVMGLSFKIPSLSIISTLMTIGSPIVAVFLTIRFRKAVIDIEEGFSFGRAFLFTFMTGIYASIWIAVFVYVYLAYMDGGYIFNAYEAMLTQPEYTAQLQESGFMSTINAAGGLDNFVDTMRSIPPANYAGMVIYMTIFSAPFISAIISAICRKAPRFPQSGGLV